jgi:flagellar M-ring protein FliF
MTSLLTGLRSLGALRLAAMVGVALICLGLLGFLALRNGDGPMALLYADLDLREAGQVVDQLDKARIPHRTEAGGSRILVPAEHVDRARLLLAKEGLPSGGSIGNEIFDRSDGLTANSFQQGITQTRAMEGELARTIRSIQGVRAARVHLVLPHREPFARERQEAQASVVLTMAGAARLDREGVQAILNLISAAVPGLRPQNIAMVDSRGNLLARAGQPTGPAAAAQSGEELKRATELRLSRAVEEMLERSVGPGHVRAEAAVDLDFDQVHETQERFDPDGQVVRSQQSTTDNSKNTEAAAANVSVQNNLPNADAGAQPSGSQEQKQEETTNYEISKTVRTLVREQPQIRRISLAVMVDGIASRTPDGTVAWAERPQEEVARISTLVRTAIGYNEARGDRVDVVTMRFAGPEEGPDPAAAPFWARLDKADLFRLVENGLVALAVLAALLLVLRPIALRVSVAAKPAIAGTTAASLPGADAPARLENAADEMVQVANVEGAMRMASIRRVSALVDERIEDSVAMLRNWLAEAG